MTAALAVVAAVAAVLAVMLVVVTTRWRQARRDAAASASEAAAASALAAGAEASVQQITARASAADASAQDVAARVSAAEAKAEQAAASADAASSRARDSDAQVASLQRQLAAVTSVAAAASAATPGDPASPVIDAVWALQQLQVKLARRDLARVSTAAPETDGTGKLADALGEEMTRIREEIGTPGELQADLAEEPPPAVALLALRTTETLLPILTRRSDAYDVKLTGGRPQVEVTVACEGAEPGGFPDADTDAVAAAIAGAGGTLSFDRTDDGRVRARLVCRTGR